MIETAGVRLPGAQHLPLRTLDERSVQLLDPDRPVVVYCHDLQCDMSPRAAWRLEALGVPDVTDYAAGKMDWLAFDHPYEGSAVLAAEATDRAPPTCMLGDPPAVVRERLDASPTGICVVVNGHGVVMGIQMATGSGEQASDAANALTFGIATVRPSEELETLVGRMERTQVETIVVTRSDGTLVGTLDRDAARQRLATSAEDVSTHLRG